MEIVDSDAFLSMPASTQNLYFHLNMRADDDGFVNSPKAIIRSVGVSEDDMNVLIMKKFVIPFESGIVVIKHWRINNYLRGDRYSETKYKVEKSTLLLDENNAYTQGEKLGIPNGYPDKNSIEKIREDKISIDTEEKNAKQMVYPTFEEVMEYACSRDRQDLAKKFYDYFNTPDDKGRIWIDKSGDKVRNWKQKFITWESRNQQGTQKKDHKEELYDRIMRGDFDE